ncbi:rhodanese-like domain-containing protein [Candidatus Roseilinea sp. NK_OTU-006]|uniref:rhodanese-like domain-containing protein n=1 Tax=Candidatus Roseilinea sp. NK_OTU-006 TaxID=2704250 RepID=UPI0026AE3BE0|nr:rhodanese-like domain-containing protein [Candidatus Roseilinea sp. NK_OTU-006]
MVDVRDPEAYAAGHVPGAINIPLAELEDRLSELAAGAPIAMHCGMAHRGESRGERAATLWRAQGFDASALEGGLPAWQHRPRP